MNRQLESDGERLGPGGAAGLRRSWGPRLLHARTPRFVWWPGGPVSCPPGERTLSVPALGPPRPPPPGLSAEKFGCGSRVAAPAWRSCGAERSAACSPPAPAHARCTARAAGPAGPRCDLQRLSDSPKPFSSCAGARAGLGQGSSQARGKRVHSNTPTQGVFGKGDTASGELESLSTPREKRETQWSAHTGREGAKPAAAEVASTLVREN